MELERIFLKRCFIKHKPEVTARKEIRLKTKPGNQSAKVQYTLEIRPPLIHLNDPKEFYLDVIGSQNKWSAKFKFTENLADLQSSVGKIERGNVGKIQYLRISPCENNIESRYVMDSLKVTQNLEAMEIYHLLKSPQFYKLLPSELRSCSLQDYSLITQYNCEGLEKGKFNVSLPLANKYLFEESAYGNFKPPLTYSLEFSDITVGL
ncbi:unnamed protein product [Schistosoma haematobium]|nr:unnamed protein product [Schistosoma haematobium]